MKANAHPDLSGVLGLLLDAICVVDRQGRFISVSGACERIFGYTPQEMVGKSMMELIFHEDHARTLQAVEKIEAGHAQLHFENRYVRKDGQLVHLMWSARYSEDDQVRVAVARDVTEHRRAPAAQAASATASDQEVRRWRLSATPPSLVPPGFAPIPLSAQDFTVLRVLATAGELAPRESIVKALGKDYFDYDQRRLDTQMRRLRRKVEQACGLKLPVVTLRGAGYRFYEDIDVIR